MFRVAVLGDDPQSAELVRRYACVPGVEAFTAPDAASAAGVDLVDLCLPFAGILEAVRQLKGATDWLLLPCPFADSAEVAARILSTIKRQRQKAFVRNVLPFHPALARALEVQNSGGLGRVTSLVLELALPRASAGPAGSVSLSIPPLAAWYPALDLLLQLAGDAVSLEGCAATPGVPEFSVALRAATGAGVIFRCRPGAEERPAYHLTLDGAAGRLTAEVHDHTRGGAPPAADSVTVTHSRFTRTFPVPKADPAELALATALLCLCRGDEFAPAAPARALKVLDLAAAIVGGTMASQSELGPAVSRATALRTLHRRVGLDSAQPL